MAREGLKPRRSIVQFALRASREAGGGGRGAEGACRAFSTVVKVRTQRRESFRDIALTKSYTLCVDHQDRDLHPARRLLTRYDLLSLRLTAMARGSWQTQHPPSFRVRRKRSAPPAFRVRRRAGALSILGRRVPSGRRRTCSGCRDRAGRRGHGRPSRQARRSSDARPGGPAPAPRCGCRAGRRGRRRTRHRVGRKRRRRQAWRLPVQVGIMPAF